MFERDVCDDLSKMMEKDIDGKIQKSEKKADVDNLETSLDLFGSAGKTHELANT